MLKLANFIKAVWAQSGFQLKRVPVAHSTDVDRYWGRHTVKSDGFRSEDDSIKYLEVRFVEYPLFREFMELYGSHDGEVVLDYGCGPGNDLVGFLVYTRAKKVIGVDISQRALHLARFRLALHQMDPCRIELIHSADSVHKIPLLDTGVDYIYCEGVLHHTSTPEAILSEFFRILRNGGRGSIMVYNRDSLWLHLYTAYQKMILEKAFPGMDVMQAFSKNTDGADCPIARCYANDHFSKLCENAGFQVNYVGGYFSWYELKLLKELGQQALADQRLGQEHREFIGSLVYDSRGYPLYKGKHAGIGGVYRLSKL